MVGWLGLLPLYWPQGVQVAVAASGAEPPFVAVPEVGDVVGVAVAGAVDVLVAVGDNVGVFTAVGVDVFAAVAVGEGHGVAVGRGGGVGSGGGFGTTSGCAGTLFGVAAGAVVGRGVGRCAVVGEAVDATVGKAARMMSDCGALGAGCWSTKSKALASASTHNPALMPTTRRRGWFFNRAHADRSTACHPDPYPSLTNGILPSGLVALVAVPSQWHSVARTCACVLLDRLRR